MHAEARSSYVLQRKPEKVYVSTHARDPAPLNTALARRPRARSSWLRNAEFAPACDPSFHQLRPMSRSDSVARTVSDFGGIMRILLAALLFVWPLTTYATIEGTLWDPTIPGEGWTVESQNDLAFITYYMYEDGRPAFRTALANVTYVSGASRYSGTLYRTENRTNSTAVGSFTGELRVLPDGRVRGTFNAAGVIRNVENFDYNFSETLDRFHGTWLIAQFDSTPIGDGLATMARFASTISQDQFGRFRAFQTSQGFTGYIEIIAADGRVRSFTDFQNGTGALFEGTASDDSAVGIGYLVNSASFARLGPDQFGLAKSVTNTEGEAASLPPFFLASSENKSVVERDARAARFAFYNARPK